MKKVGVKNLTYEQKLKIESLSQTKMTQKNIAKEVGCSLRSIQRELSRASINGKYSAKYSHQQSMIAKKNKGAPSIFETDKNLAKYISKLILEDNLSLLEIKELCKIQNIDCPSRTTLYRSIDEGLIPNVTREDLRSNETTMFSKGLIQIPKHIREQLNLKDKDKVSLKLEGKSIVITKITD